MRRLAQAATTGVLVAGLLGAGAATAVAAEQVDAPSVVVSTSPLKAQVDLSKLTLDLSDTNVDISLNHGVHGTLLGIGVHICL